MCLEIKNASALLKPHTTSLLSRLIFGLLSLLSRALFSSRFAESSLFQEVPRKAIIHRIKFPPLQSLTFLQSEKSVL